MALKAVLWSKLDSPYFKPPPLHVHVVAPIDQPMVVSWDFTESSARPASTKRNKVAVISDGSTVAKITVYEEFAEKISEGHDYILRGYSLRGVSAFAINITRSTVFFSSAPVLVCQKLKEEAVALLNPTSPLTPLGSCDSAEGLVTVEGEIVEVKKRYNIVKQILKIIIMKGIGLIKTSFFILLSRYPLLRGSGVG